MSDDLVQWLRAQLDEDERLAWEAKMAPWRRNGSMVEGEEGWVATSDSYADADHIAEHDPARVLAEVEAKRRILAEHETDKRWPLDRSRMGCRTCRLRGDVAVDREWPCLTLRLLALPFGYRPGYRDEWRP